MHHVSVVAAQVEVAARFYDAVFAAMGGGRVVSWADLDDADEVGEEAIGYGMGDEAVLWVIAGRSSTRSAHVALQVAGAAAVDAVAARAGTPARHRDHDRPGYYGVMLADPDGNLLEIFCWPRG